MGCLLLGSMAFDTRSTAPHLTDPRLFLPQILVPHFPIIQLIKNKLHKG